MITRSDKHLARIQQVDSPRAGRSLHPMYLIFQMLMIGWYSSAWILLFVVGSLLVARVSPLGGTVVAFGAVWGMTIFLLVFVYPEWPHNLRLCRRLRRSVLRDPDTPAWVDGARIVELVPRERWKKVCLDTATDLMLLKVDRTGVQMIGDRYLYDLPAESILGAEFQAISPPGWFCKSYMTLVYVRTADGTIELPISYRDHNLGNLRSVHRKSQSLELTEQIATLSQGHLYQAPQAPLDLSPSAARRSENPYAAPAIVDEGT